MRLQFAVEFPTESIQYRKPPMLYTAENSSEITDEIDITYTGQSKKLTPDNSSLSPELQDALIATFRSLKKTLTVRVLADRPVETFWKREAKIEALQRQVRDGFTIIARQVYE